MNNEESSKILSKKLKSFNQVFHKNEVIVMDKKNKIFSKKFNDVLDMYEETEINCNFIRFYTEENTFIDISLKEGKLSIRGIEQLKITPKNYIQLIIEQEEV